jgi:3-mercaptopyruvate sulfurtransferase SseA
MSNRKIYFPLALFILTALACNAITPQSQPTSAPARIQPTQAQLPQTENDVPRVSVVDAKSALDSGEAVIVDVRGAEFFAQGHIAGAVNMPLKNIEINPAGVNLNKDQWIITYCT